MAKKKGDQPSMSSYWRELFRAEPHLLKLKSNKELRERWEKDHPGLSFNERQSQALANVKSIERKRHKKGGRPKGSVAVGSANGGTKPAHVPQIALERLEVSIDHCLSTARMLDATALEKAIKYLRAARNEVVWKSGQP
jgi:hypothetical protein